MILARAVRSSLVQDHASPCRSTRAEVRAFPRQPLRPAVRPSGSEPGGDRHQPRDGARSWVGRRPASGRPPASRHRRPPRARCSPDQKYGRREVPSRRPAAACRERRHGRPTGTSRPSTGGSSTGPRDGRRPLGPPPQRSPTCAPRSCSGDRRVISPSNVIITRMVHGARTADWRSTRVMAAVPGSSCFMEAARAGPASTTARRRSGIFQAQARA